MKDSDYRPPNWPPTPGQLHIPQDSKSKKERKTEVQHLIQIAIWDEESQAYQFTDFRFAIDNCKEGMVRYIVKGWDIQIDIKRMADAED